MKQKDMKNIFLITIIIILSSCSRTANENIEINQLITPDYTFSNYFFDCRLNDGSSLLKLESFLSDFIKKSIFENKSLYALSVFFPENVGIEKFKISIRNNSDDDIFSDVINQLSQNGFDEIASCNFNPAIFKGLQLYKFIDEQQSSSNTIEILRCLYKPGFNYGTFRISLDRFINKINRSKIQYGIDYYQEELRSNEFLWINYFYAEDFNNNISSYWLNDPDSIEIKNEFNDNAECIDAMKYKFFEI